MVRLNSTWPHLIVVGLTNGLIKHIAPHVLLSRMKECIRSPLQMKIALMEDLLELALCTQY